ncbi:retroelement pol poly [Olea europaea subsp. europaea]|uniref:Retroelement pol poly n=1 Tax=Olea europaea subsp. europaea TaxID=158383 RepID=A0A8S0UX19_OLEEU|nr:retroelement pol poly [Olea europaea subsp. europaea]
MLRDVLFVPQFKLNLLSVSSLTTGTNLSLNFFHDQFIIQEASSRKMIGKGSIIQGLYVLDTKDFNSVSDAFIGSVSAHVWHNRLGHLSFKRLDVLKDHLPYDTEMSNKHLPCYICPLAKQRRLSFESHNHLSNQPFDLIHCDIWGPYHVTSHFGYRYFMTLVDDHFRFTWLYMLKQKSDAVGAVHRFFNLVATQFRAVIKSFRSDNAGELSFKDFFSEKGVIHQFSCVERPQQNSVVERKHQHLLNVARALFFQSRVPIKFWSECVLTAAYLINRTLAPILHHKTPFEVLHGRKANYSCMRVFGCLGFASTLNAYRTKFQPRARMCVFLGYPSGIKGFKLLDVSSKQIFIPRDVVFHEDIFPFHTIRSNDKVLDPFLIWFYPHLHYLFHMICMWIVIPLLLQFISQVHNPFLNILSQIYLMPPLVIDPVESLDLHHI